MKNIHTTTNIPDPPTPSMIFEFFVLRFIIYFDFCFTLSLFSAIAIFKLHFLNQHQRCLNYTMIIFVIFFQSSSNPLSSRISKIGGVIITIQTGLHVRFSFSIHKTFKWIVIISMSPLPTQFLLIPILYFASIFHQQSFVFLFSVDYYFEPLQKRDTLHTATVQILSQTASATTTHYPIPTSQISFVHRNGWKKLSRIYLRPKAISFHISQTHSVFCKR